MESESTSTRLSPDAVSDLVEELVNRGELRVDRCIDLSDVSEFVQELELGEDDGQALQEALEDRGYDVRDDCGRGETQATSYLNDQLADRTTDAMSLFLQEV